MPEAQNQRGQAIRRAIMVSMEVTGPGFYTHDHYDEAHAELGELLRELKDLRKGLHVAHGSVCGCKYPGKAGVCKSVGFAVLKT